MAVADGRASFSFVNSTTPMGQKRRMSVFRWLEFVAMLMIYILFLQEPQVRSSTIAPCSQLISWCTAQQERWVRAVHILFYRYYRSSSWPRRSLNTKLLFFKRMSGESGEHHRSHSKGLQLYTRLWYRLPLSFQIHLVVSFLLAFLKSELRLSLGRCHSSQSISLWESAFALGYRPVIA